MKEQGYRGWVILAPLLCICDGFQIKDNKKNEVTRESWRGILLMDRPGKTFTYWEGVHISSDTKMRTFQPHTEPQEEQVSRGIASAFLFHKMRQSMGRSGENMREA